ncbi:hypothetical protein AHF37_01593 [Paragonimus kellicotti]|nr:hypothetical protein AHF37_01593 [Paragonimus kellicotti]
MSAVLSGPTALTHDVNSYIPDRHRSQPAPSFQHFSSRRHPHDQVGRLSPHLSPAPHPNESSSPGNLLETKTFPSEHPGDALPSTRSMPLCTRCHQPILDPYLYRILDCSWHESCAVCSACSAELSDVCFMHEGKLFCRKDYDRLHATRCVNCRQPMRSHELFMRARHPPSSPDKPARPDLIFHVSCFVCSVCQQPLAAGDPYTIDCDTNRPVCRTDYLASRSAVSPTSRADPSESSPPHPRPQSDDPQWIAPQSCLSGSPESTRLRFRYDAHLSSSSTNPALFNGSSSKRIRTSLTEEQRSRLQKAYELNARPSKLVRESLASMLSVPLRVVQVWFQNQRARDKRAFDQLQRQQAKRSQHRVDRSTANWTNDGGDPKRSNVSPAMMTPSPRTSVESGSFAEFDGLSGDRFQGRSGVRTVEVGDHVASNSQLWIPASQSVWQMGSGLADSAVR